MCAQKSARDGRRPLEDHERAHVHVRGLLLLREERRVDRAQPVLVSLLRHELSLPGRIVSVKLLGIVLAVQVALGLTLVALVATDNLPFTATATPTGARRGRRPCTRTASTGRPRSPARRQVEMGPRPAGSPESRRLAARLKRIVPRGRYQRVPGGLRNVIGTVRGREPGYVVRRRALRHRRPSGASSARTTARPAPPSWRSSRARSSARATRSTSSSSTARSCPRGSDGEFEVEALRGRKVAAPAFARRARDGPARLRGRPRLAHPARGQLGSWLVAAAARRRRGAWAPRGVFPARDRRAPSPTTTFPFIEPGRARRST